MRKLLTAISMATLFSASTALAQQAPQPLSVTVDGATMSFNSGSFTIDPRAGQVVIESDRHKPIVANRDNVNRVLRNIEAELRRTKGRAIEGEVEVVQK